MQEQYDAAKLSGTEQCHQLQDSGKQHTRIYHSGNLNLQMKPTYDGDGP